MDESNGQVSWYTGDNEATISLINNKKWDSADAMANSYSNLEKMTGDPSKIVRLPDFDNRDEVSNFYKKLGRPETTEGYKLEQGDNDDEEATGLFKQIAYKNGLSTRQAEGVYEQFNTGVNALNEKQAKQQEDNINKNLTELKENWGDKYDEKMDKAKAGFKAVGLEESKVEGIAGILGLEDTIKLFSGIGKGVSEPSFVEGGGTATSGSIKEQLDEIKANPDYLNPLKNKQLIAKATNLHKALIEINNSKK